ncbi:hypothetical protein [Anaerolinea sp.]|uniref:hypothetical protein n=1 Tax=Anaerolinea sp. TaxID=1872519 RepID=UPI002ACE8C3F|nr:hypothetical protein [Anaerolinea sp.]
MTAVNQKSLELFQEFAEEIKIFGQSLSDLLQTGEIADKTKLRFWLEENYPKALELLSSCHEYLTAYISGQSTENNVAFPSSDAEKNTENHNQKKQNHNLTPKQAYDKARCGEGPSKFTREIACLDPKYAYVYALHVDKGPRDDTRKAACQDPYYACEYAKDVDRGPRDDTRQGACQKPYCAQKYALEVDQAPRDDTRQAACLDPRYAYLYARYVDRCARDDTRVAAWADVRRGKEYDKYFHLT